MYQIVDHVNSLVIELMEIMGLLRDADMERVDEAEDSTRVAGDRVRGLIQAIREEREDGNTAEPPEQEEAAEDVQVDGRGFARLVARVRKEAESMREQQEQ